MNCAPHDKFFGPHYGILCGKRALLESLFAYKVRPATNELPGKFETGTQNHEGIAGVLGALEYFGWVSTQFGDDQAEASSGGSYQGRRLDERMATYSFRIGDLPPREIAKRLAEQGIYVWDGNYYAINVTERLGLEDKGGMLRVGAAH